MAFGDAVGIQQAGTFRKHGQRALPQGEGHYLPVEPEHFEIFQGGPQPIGAQ